jgi:hypothetical protein
VKAPELKPEPHLYSKNATIEKIYGILQGNPRGILFCPDELRGWVDGMTRYRQKGSDMPHWLSRFRAEEDKIDRKTGPETTVEVIGGPVSVCGTTQIGIFMIMVDDNG